MKYWLSHIRNLETFIDDHERLLDIWEAGGVDGLVVGPLQFGTGERLAHSRGLRAFSPPTDTRVIFDPDPRFYDMFSTTTPTAPPGDDRELRARLRTAFDAVVARGWELWLFDPFTGAAGLPDINDNAERILDPAARRAFKARMLDTVAAFPMATGVIIDGPAWGFEITEIDYVVMAERRRLFELPASAAVCAQLGYDRGALQAAADHLEHRLHHLSPGEVRLHAAGGAGGAAQLFGGPGFTEWLRFRSDALTSFYADMKATLVEHAGREVGLAVCPRTPAIGPVAGYDYARCGEIVDVVMPKLYWWQRGYDGLVGTAWRWASTLTQWNPELSVADACAVTRAFFGDSMPLVDELIDFDRVIDAAWVREVTMRETTRALAVIGGNARVVPWVDSGRAPHDGDPMTAAHLDALLEAAASCGIQQATYFNSTKMSPADWTVLSHHGGASWHPSQTPGWVPPDQPTV